MKKESSKKQLLQDFLAQHCELRPLMHDAKPLTDKCFVMSTRDCKLFMAEAHAQGIRNAIGQTEEVMADAKKYSDFTRVIMVYNWSAPDPGMDTIQLPERLIEMLSPEQASVVLRNLQGIQKDTEEGKLRRETVQSLFADKAIVKTCYALDGERQYVITGKTSISDRKHYAERYAEQVATNALFDLAKALNAQIRKRIPKGARGKWFVEGRNTGAKKLRYGADAQSELIMTDEGALICLELIKDPSLRGDIADLLQKAMTDPFGLSLKHYMGKHAVIKLSGAKPEE